MCHHNSDRLKHHIQETIVLCVVGGRDALIDLPCYSPESSSQPGKSVLNRSFQKPVKQQDDSSVLQDDSLALWKLPFLRQFPGTYWGMLECGSLHGLALSACGFCDFLCPLLMDFFRILFLTGISLPSHQSLGMSLLSYFFLPCYGSSKEIIKFLYKLHRSQWYQHWHFWGAHHVMSLFQWDRSKSSSHPDFILYLALHDQFFRLYS